MNDTLMHGEPSEICVSSERESGQVIRYLEALWHI